MCGLAVLCVVLLVLLVILLELVLVGRRRSVGMGVSGCMVCVWVRVVVVPFICCMWWRMRGLE